MNEFLLNCLQEIAKNITNIQIALVALNGYLNGMDDCDTQEKTNFYPTITQENEKTEIRQIESNCNGIIHDFKFTEKEIMKMPLQFRKEYRIDGSVVRCRKRRTGDNKFTYEMRYRRDGYNVTATSKNLEDCKKKFLAKLKEADKQTKGAKENQTNFKVFALHYFETYKKRKVAEITYKNDCKLLNTHLLPKFGRYNLKDIKPQDCQELLDDLTDQGKGRTTELCHTALNQIFKAAIKYGYINNNPLDLVIKQKHSYKHGKAFTYEEEAAFIKEFQKDKFAAVFITALYTGMRPNEYAYAEFTEKFVITKNSKRKGGKIEYKKIPIHPMLKPFVTPQFIKEFNELKNTRLPTVQQHFYKIAKTLGKRQSKPYDMRTTFYTRCEMCSVSEPARNEFVGHSAGVLKDTYTDLPDDYLFEEGQKIRYNLKF